VNTIGSGLRTLIAIAMLTAVSACSTATGNGSGAVEGQPPSNSVQKLEYYPYQVKGYQNSYPRRSVLVLMPSDDRDLSAAPNHEALDGKPYLGVVLGRDGDVIQRLYSDPLGPIAQKAIAGAAQEAGMTAETADYSDYTPSRAREQDYVIVSVIKRCAVKKRHGAGKAWNTAADFAIAVIVFKPPFKIPFWQGVLQSTYNDPPVGSFGLGSEDEAGIYDDHGEVLSVALTRAIAGIFERNDFRTLVKQDQIHQR
jgi:hypothetical protein